MKTLSGFFVLSLFVSFSAATALSPIFASHSTELKDVEYKFNQDKLDSADSDFDFFRSYVDYFYKLIKQNKNEIHLLDTTYSVAGWCTGDAHPENFGVLLLNDGSPVFTMNDIDDSAPCPLVLDVLRLMVSARLVDQNINIEKILKYYLKGLNEEGLEAPTPILSLLEQSLKLGVSPSAKKVQKNKLIRSKHSFEVSPEDKVKIEHELQYLKSVVGDFKWIDVMGTQKKGGGSGGLLRYEVLIQHNGGLTHLELKEETTPGVAPVALSIPPDDERIMTSLIYDLGPKISKYYQPVFINGKCMVVRPRFSGNTGVDLSEFSTEETKKIIYYEAYVLAHIHLQSVHDKKEWISRVEALYSDSIENDIEKLQNHFIKKLKSLK